MLKKKIWVSFFVLVLAFTSCKGDLDINVGIDIKGTWQLYETCLSVGCTPTDPSLEVTIEFREDDLIEKQNNLVIGAAEYTVGQVQNDADQTIYLLFVNDASWQLTVTETMLDILVGSTFRRYNKVD